MDSTLTGIAKCKEFIMCQMLVVLTIEEEFLHLQGDNNTVVHCSLKECFRVSRICYLSMLHLDDLVVQVLDLWPFAVTRMIS